MKDKEMSMDYHKGWLDGFEARSTDIYLAINEVKFMVKNQKLEIKKEDVEKVFKLLADVLNNNIK